MNNFKLVIATLLLICLIGFADTAYINQALDKHKIATVYQNQPKILGFGVEQKGNYLSIREVIHGTPAHKAGVLSKDILVSFNYVQVSNVDKLKEMINGVNRDEKVVLGVIREGERKVVYVAFNPRVIETY